MVSTNEPISAFAVYNSKRKNSTPTNYNKKFKKQSSAKEEFNTVKNKQDKSKTFSGNDEKVKMSTLKDDQASAMRRNTSIKKLNNYIANKKRQAVHNANLNRKMKSKKQNISYVSSSNSTNNNVDSNRVKTDKIDETEGNKISNDLKAQKKINKRSLKKRTSRQNSRNEINRKGIGKLQKETQPSLTKGEFDKIKDDIWIDPIQKSKLTLTWLISPLNPETFFENNWERTPVHIRRHAVNYYSDLMSTPMLDKILRDQYVLYSKNIDITSYSNGVRETHNPVGRAVPSVVWDYYLNGCSVRMLNPQTFIPKLHALNAILQEFFGCFVGANSYLTPPNSQGFAPHYDDIEAFILQVEGKKRWRLYKPPKESDYLARYSSKDFKQEEIGEPILDTVVEAGDMLYLPRGTVHQGETINNTHSLHITISVYQKNSWADFLERLLPQALQKATENDSQFREGLPLDYTQYTGLVHANNKSNERLKFEKKIKSLLTCLMDYINIDEAADEVVKNHIHDFLPPVLTKYEEDCSVAQDGERITKNGIVENRVEIEPDTEVRLVRRHCVRLVKESDAYKLYYSTENSKEYHEFEPQYLEVGEEFVQAVKDLIVSYPNFVAVTDLSIKNIDDKIQIVKDLWEKEIVVTRVPLETLDD